MTESRKNGKVVSAKVETEVVAKAQRRQYTDAYKQRILAEAAACHSPSEVGTRRREGLYSSLLWKWRQRTERAPPTLPQPRRLRRQMQHLLRLRRINPDRSR